VLSLIEKAEQGDRPRGGGGSREKLRKNEFTLDDFRKQLNHDPAAWGRSKHPRDDPGLGNLKQSRTTSPTRSRWGASRRFISSMAPDERATIGSSRQPPQADRERERTTSKR